MLEQARHARHLVDDGEQQSLAAVELFIEVARDQTGGRADTAHGDIGQAGFAPDLTAGRYQLAAARGAAIRCDSPTAIGESAAHVSRVA